jgi:alkanesulfonate monooxygenase SsuD/methylene tetrahydromethanopterin reductase-like flavin-dependent oxidoreductase (luciferase family)
MEIGMSLPTMARGATRATTLQWCAGIDVGPFSSVSCGERHTFHNPEMLVTMAAAAALTRRARIFLNLVVLPTHPAAVIAKQIATLDMLSDGRVTVGVGIGGREADYRAAGASFGNRHQRLDDGVAELRRLWVGGAAFEGADPIGPEMVQSGGPEILAGAMGPKALARAARWADGVSGFSVTAAAAEFSDAVTGATQAWHDAGRDTPPRVVSGCFFSLGVPDSADTLRCFTEDYLRIFGRGFAADVAAAMEASTPDRVRRALDDAAAAGVDEFILVPATVDVRCLDATVDLLTAH